MNFLRRAGAILMVVAIFVSSCNKYADDFEQINTKLDALAAQVAGVTQLTADMAALKTQVTALQTAVAALPTATAQAAQFAAVKVETDKILAEIAKISTTLTAVAANGVATKAVVDQLKIDLAALTTKVTADNAAMTVKLNGLAATDVEQSKQLTDLIAANNALLVIVTDVQVKMDAAAKTGTDADEVTALTIGGLQAMLEAQKIQLDQLLANSNMYNYPVSITTDAEVAFYMTKIAIWPAGGMVNSTFTVDTKNISAGKLADLRTICNNIIAVIGGAGSNVNIKSKVGDALTFNKLTTVTGDYTITGADVADDMLSTVNGTVTFNYDGAYTAPALTSVGGGLILVRVTAGTLKNATVTAVDGVVGTTGINFPATVVGGKVSDGVNPDGILVYPEAASVNLLSGGVTSLTAVIATYVKLGEATYPTGLMVNAPKATTLDLSGMKTVTTGMLDLTAAATCVPDLSNFATTTAKPINVTIAGPTTITLPKYVAGTLISDATTVTLDKHEGLVNPVLAKVTKLTMNSLNNPLAVASYTKLVELTVLGKVATVVPMATTTTVTVTSANADLTTVSLGGTISTASLSGAAKLANVTTAGVVNTFILNDCDKVAGMTLGHKHYEGGPGSTMTVTNNAILASLTTSCEEMLALTVTNNAKLAAANFASYVVRTVSGNPTITINTNALTGDYVKGVAATTTTPYVECKITSAAFSTLKTYIALHTAPVLAMDLDNVSLAGAALPTTAVTLSARMAADLDATAEWLIAPVSKRGNDGVGAITDLVEVTHVL